MTRRQKLFRSLTDTFHDRAIASVDAIEAATWALLMDHSIWCETDGIFSDFPANKIFDLQEDDAPRAQP